jgi:hypothetical protein
MPTIDEALEILEDTGPEFAGGLANHGPMAAEALFALGRQDAALPWAARYRRRLRDHPEARNPIAPESWQEALGDGARVGDWIALFDRQLEEAPWRDVLETWTARFAPGIVTAATHGVIRTAHAVRSLEQEETPLRLHELAEGLGYWAARYQRLPEASAARGTLRPSAAIGDVEVIPLERRATQGLITVGLRSLDDFAPFAGTINLVDTSGDVDAFVSDMTETFAHVYLANASGGRVIHFVHAVTGPSAVRLLAPHLSAETASMALRYAWQAGAALYAAFGEQPRAETVADAPEDIDDLIDRSVATGDEHAIKFTEACLREYRLNPQPVYLVAAQDATRRLSKTTG